MKNFKDKFNITEDFLNIVVINSQEELKKYEEKVKQKYIWDGDGEEWKAFSNNIKLLYNSLENVFNDTWLQDIENHPINDLKDNIKKIELGMIDLEEFKNNFNKTLNYSNLEPSKETEKIFSYVDEAINLNKYSIKEVSYYSNFFGERISELYPNAKGISSETNALKYSFKDPKRNLLIINNDLNLPEDSILDVYGNIKAKNINGGIIGCQSLEAKNINAMKIIASNIEADNLLINVKGKKPIHNTILMDFTNHIDILENLSDEKRKDTLGETKYDNFDILVGDFDVNEPTDSKNIIFEDEKTNSKINLSLEFLPNIKLSGGKLNIKENLIGKKIWAGSIQANNIYCMNLIAGSEKNNFDISNQKIIDIYEKQSGYRFKEIYAKPEKYLQGSLIQAKNITCDNIKADYLKTDKMICENKAILNEMDVETLIIKSNNVINKLPDTRQEELNFSPRPLGKNVEKIQEKGKK